LDRQEILADFGQLFVMALDGRVLPADVAEFFRTFRIGGIILFADNYSDPAQLRRLIDELQSRCAAPDRPLFVSTDHEGGRVQRFRDGFRRVPAMALCGRSSPESTEEMHRAMARELRGVGVNVNWAPVADLCEAETPGAIGDRSFGPDPETTARHVTAAVRGLQSEGLMACAKHFPGHGGTRQDSHRELPVVGDAWADIDAREMVPFRAAIAAGVEAVMTAHVLYPAVDANWPASLSPSWIDGILRRRLAFDGLVVTDAIEMTALRERWTPAECGRRALAAGSDVLIYYREAFQFTAFADLRRAVRDGELDLAALSRSVERVRRAKSALFSRLHATS
jgi:beta-N-acetylhexosaminidase